MQSFIRNTMCMIKFLSKTSRRSSLREILVTCTLFEGGGDNAVSLVCGVDVFEEAAHPGVGTDVWIGRCCATKGAKYVHNGSVATNIIGEVLIDRLRK